MKAAQTVRPFFFLLGVIAVAWLFAGPQVDKSIAESEVEGSSAGTAPRPTELTTRGDWVCNSDNCKFHAVSGGSPFRSVVAQDCPFCRTALSVAQ